MSAITTAPIVSIVTSLSPLCRRCNQPFRQFKTKNQKYCDGCRDFNETNKFSEKRDCIKCSESFLALHPGTNKCENCRDVYSKCSNCKCTIRRTNNSKLKECGRCRALTPEQKKKQDWYNRQVDKEEVKGCNNCLFGKLNKNSDTKYECMKSLALSCRPFMMNNNWKSWEQEDE